MAKKSNLDKKKSGQDKEEKNNAKLIQLKNPIFAQPQETKQDKAALPASSPNGRRERADKFIIKATPQLIAEWAKSKAELSPPDSSNKAIENIQGTKTKEENRPHADNAHTEVKTKALPLEAKTTMKEFSNLGIKPQENKVSQAPDSTPAPVNKPKNEGVTRL